MKIPEVESIDTAFTKRLASLKEKAARYGCIPEEEKPSLVPNPSQIAAILREKGFPKRHTEQLSAGMFGPGAAKADELLKKISHWDALILLIGNRGPGKTQIATYWAAKIIENDTPSVRYVKCADLLGEIKATWHDGGRSIGTEQDVMRKYRKVRYLVIDEFHEKGGSDWEARCLINLIDHRYDDMLCTIIIANMSKDEVEHAINPSIIDRATQTGGRIVCDWPSYRI